MSLACDDSTSRFRRYGINLSNAVSFDGTKQRLSSILNFSSLILQFFREHRVLVCNCMTISVVPVTRGLSPCFPRALTCYTGQNDHCQCWLGITVLIRAMYERLFLSKHKAVFYLTALQLRQFCRIVVFIAHLAHILY